jgi:hypothetical protein
MRNSRGDSDSAGEFARQKAAELENDVNVALAFGEAGSQPAPSPAAKLTEEHGNTARRLLLDTGSPPLERLPEQPAAGDQASMGGDNKKERQYRRGLPKLKFR